MRLFLSLLLLLVSFVDTFALPISPLLKLGLKTWDDAAKIALKVSGKSLTDDAVKATAKTLEKASTKYGDDVLKQSLHGGVEVSEQALRHGNRFVKALRLCPTHIAARNLALHSDDVLKLSAKYGDDIVRLNAKIPGQTSKVVDICKKSGFPVEEGLKLFDTGLREADLTRVIGALNRTKDTHIQNQFLKSLRVGGNKFVDKIFAQSGRQILARGLSSAMIITAGGVAVATVKGAENLTTSATAAGEATKAATQTATILLLSTNSTPKQLEAATQILTKNADIAEGSTLGGVLRQPLSILVIFFGIACVVWVILKGLHQKHPVASPPSYDDAVEKSKDSASITVSSATIPQAIASPEHPGKDDKQSQNGISEDVPRE